MKTGGGRRTAIGNVHKATITFRPAPEIYRAVEQFGVDMGGISYNAAVSVLLAEALFARHRHPANVAMGLRPCEPVTTGRSSDETSS